MRRIPKFTSTKSEREFWDTYDAVEVLGEKGWKVSKPGSTYVTSLYVTKVGSRGAVIRIPREWLASIGARKGRRIKAQVMGKRLVMEFGLRSCPLRRLSLRFIATLQGISALRKIKSCRASFPWCREAFRHSAAEIPGTGHGN